MYLNLKTYEFTFRELDNRVVCIKVNHGELELINDRDDWTDDTQSDDDSEDTGDQTDDEDGW